MKIELVTYKSGDSDRYWTYTLLINSDHVKSIPIIYRLYDKEKTAIRNGLKLLNKTLEKLNCV